MQTGAVIKLKGRSGAESKFCQTWVFARKSQDSITEVFTYTRATCEEVPLFAIGLGGAVPEPYVLRTTHGQTRVDNPECLEFYCIVPACAMPGGC